MNNLVESFDDIARHVECAEVQNIKGMLWKCVIAELMSKRIIADESIFSMVEKELRKYRPEELPEREAAIMQDAVSEFRAEARQMLADIKPGDVIP